MTYDLNYFDWVVCLTIDKRYHSLGELKEQLAEKNIRADFFITGQGSDLPAQMYDYLDPPYGCTGEQKCRRNQLEILRRAKEKGCKNVLILEDDLFLEDDFDEVFNAGFGHVIENGLPWDIFLAGHNLSWATSSEITPNLRRMHSGAYCTHAIAFNHTMFDVMQTFPDKPCPLDWHMAHAIQPDPNYHVYGLWPQVATQKPSFSYVNNCYQDYSDYFKNGGKLQ